MPALVTAPILVDDQGITYIEGTATKVVEVVEHKDWADRTPEEVQQDLPHLSLGQVYAALAYYHQHKNHLDAEIARRRERVLQMRSQAGPSPVAARLRAEGKLRP